MSNDPYRPSGPSRTPGSGSRSGTSGSGRSSGSSGGDGFRSSPASSTPRSSVPQPPKPPAPRKPSPWPALAVAAAALGGLALWRGQAPGGTSGSSANTLASARSGAPSSRPAQPAASGAGDKVHILIAGDVSRSVSPALRQSAMDGLKFALKQAAPVGTPLHFVFYDRDARTRPGVIDFYEPRDLDEVSNDFVKYAPRAEKGTRQALALSRLEREANSLPPGTPTAFVLLTDGEDQDAPATTEEARKMAGRAGFRGLLVVGAQMESRSRVYLRDKLDASLAPLEGRRIVCGAEISDRDADQFHALLGQ